MSTAIRRFTGVGGCGAASPMTVVLAICLTSVLLLGYPALADSSGQRPRTESLRRVAGVGAMRNPGNDSIGASLRSSPGHHPGRGKTEHLSLVDTRFKWPTWKDFVRVVSMRDYNTRMVLLGTLILGVCAGVVGVFMLLRGRALVGDVVGHSALSGIAIAFIVMEMLQPGSGKALTGLLIGAFLAGLAGALCASAIGHCSRIKQDAALAIVLSIFFGVGAALFTVVQNIPSGNAAGLIHFVYGKTASMTAGDVALFAKATVVVLCVCGLLFKEFSLLCFDESYAAAQGWPIVTLDAMLMGLVVAVTVIGMQSVGLILVVATLIIPAAASRFWSDDIRKMTLISALLGGLSAFLGVLISALFSRIAAGAIIVLIGGVLFLISLLAGTRRGVARRVLAQWHLKKRIGRHDLLRAFYESLETLIANAQSPNLKELTEHTVPVVDLLAKRSWSPQRLDRLLSAAASDGLLRADPPGGYRLTAQGAADAWRVVRNHRLWELYLITYADIAPNHVDRNADQIEHVLEPQLIEELDRLLCERYPQMVMPSSPHAIEPSASPI